MALSITEEPSIPFPTTSLIGRESTTTALRDLVERPDVRLVTLTGPGGVGKTRIAFHLIETLREDTDLETAIVFLASANSDHLALTAIAQALGLPQASLVPIADVIAQAIGRRRMLLVLDNVEQLADALVMIPGWLATCPNLTIVATSRTMLRLSAEHVFPIDPLPTTCDDDRLSPATALFFERGRCPSPSRPHDGNNRRLRRDLLPARWPSARHRTRRRRSHPVPVAPGAARTPLHPPANPHRWPARCPGTPSHPPRHHRLVVRPAR